MQPGGHNTNCKHKHWVTADYPKNIYGKEYVEAKSIYHVFCKDCKNFINLLTGKIINEKELVRLWL